MRTLSLALLLGLVVTFTPAQEGDAPRKKREEPIKIITLDRKSPVAYEKDIEPIFVNKCNFCHSGNLKEGKFDLSSYETMMRGGKRGPAIIPGKGAESLLYKLSAKIIRPYMAPRSEEPLTPEELALIKLWIDQGAKAPTGTRTVAKVILKAPPATVTPVLGVAVSGDKSAVAASRGNQIHVYDAAKGGHLRTLIDPTLTDAEKKPVKAAHLSLVESLAYSPDGKVLASGGYQEVKLWDARTGELRRTVPGFAERVVCLAFSPDGKLLACGGGAPTQDGELKLLDVASGKVVQDIKTNGHSDTVFGLAFSPDGKLLASGGADKFVKTFDVANGKFLKAFEGHTHHVMGVGFSADGKLLASAGADNVVKIWDYEKGEQVRTINAHGKQVTSLTFIGKTKNFATCSGDQQVRFWNTDGGNVRNFSAGDDYLFCVAVSPDGSVVAAGGQEGVVRLYNGTSGALVKTLLPPGAEKPTAPKK
ncbi:MAG: c-type cytochrome domain-containing protein [Gemmataceae bacterium]